jgi:hypothetical protein
MAIYSQGEIPLRLILGADAVERVHAKLEQVAEDLETWKSTSVNTAYPLAIDH